MTRSLVINVDSDGVVYDWHGFMIPFFEARTGKTLTREDFQVWDLAKALDMPKHEFNALFDEAVWSAAFLLGEPIPGAVDGINALVAAGHRVRIVTNKILRGLHKTHAAQQQTVEWYYRQALLDDVEMVFTSSKWGKTNYPADLVVDDKPDLSWTQGTAVNVLFDQPWNHKVGRPEPTYVPSWRGGITPWRGVWRAVGWRDVLELVEQMGGGILLDKDAA